MVKVGPGELKLRRLKLEIGDDSDSDADIYLVSILSSYITFLYDVMQRGGGLLRNPKSDFFWGTHFSTFILLPKLWWTI